jgi:hypothetical protein
MGWDQRTLQSRQPCADCPFKVKSAPGWLGGYPLDSYAQPPSVGMPTSCHRTDKGASDLRTGFCAGSLATIANDPDVEPLADYAAAVEAVGPRPDCIASVDEFRAHHAPAEGFRARLLAAGVAPND